MAFELADVIPDFHLALSTPGVNLLEDVSDDESILRLTNAFWDARLDGLLSGYTVDEDGVIETVPSGGATIPRELVQVIILYAAWNAIYVQLTNMKSLFRAKAGPVEYETQQSAGVLREVAQALRERKAYLLGRLLGLTSTSTYYIDSVVERSNNLLNGLDVWYSAGTDPYARGGSY